MEDSQGRIFAWRFLRSLQPEPEPEPETMVTKWRVSEMGDGRWEMGDES